MLENVSVGVVDCARVKDVLGVSIRPRWQGRGFNTYIYSRNRLKTRVGVLSRGWDDVGDGILGIAIGILGMPLVS